MSSSSHTMSTVKRIHPKKFALWVGMTSIIMLFAALTSAYIVRKSGGNWLYFSLPTAFYYSTALIVASSVALHFSYKAFLREKFELYRALLVAGFLLGFGFVALQYQGWLQLGEIGVLIHTNQSSSFIYLISAMHVAHVLGGLAALVVALVYGLLPRYHAVTPKRKLRLELIFTYWHFVDILWVYLLLFFILQQ